MAARWLPRARACFLAALAVSFCLPSLEANAPLAFADISPIAVASGLSSPIGVAVDSAGDVYFAEQYGGTLKVLRRGESAPTTLLSGLFHPAGVAVDSAGTVYFTDGVGSYPSDGLGGVKKLPRGATSPTTLVSGLNDPIGLAVNSRGDVYFTQGNAVGTLNVVRSGTTSSSTLLTSLYFPGGVAVNKSDDIVLIDGSTVSYANQGSIKQIPDGGSQVTTILSGLTVPVAVTFDGGGNVVFTDDPGNGHAAIRSLSSGSTTPTTLLTMSAGAYGVAADGNGDIYFTDISGGTLDKLPGAVAPKAKNNPSNIPPGTNVDIDWWRLPDSDGDGIPDYWETNGVWVNNKKLDLAAAGAHVGKKDLFVYVDYEDGHQFDHSVFDRVHAAFAASRLTPQVEIHFITGTSIATDAAYSIGWEKQNGKDVAHLGADLSKAAKKYGFIDKGWNGDSSVPELAKYFVSLGYRESDDRTIGFSGVRASGGWVAYTQTAPKNLWERIYTGIWSDDAIHFSEASNLTHEIGHALGLEHYGGHNCANWQDPSVGDKAGPKCQDGATDYKSVMSYAYNVLGVPEYESATPHRTRIDYSVDQKPWFDWSMGPSTGFLTFVLGQFGEDGQFYGRARGQDLDPSPADSVAAESFTKMVASVTPSGFDAFATEHGLTGRPDFPTIDASNTQFDVTGGQFQSSLVVHDSAGSQFTLIVEHGPERGTFTADGVNITYTPAAGYVGDDQVTVRATTGVLSSEPVALTFTTKPGTQPPSAGCFGSSCFGS